MFDRTCCSADCPKTDDRLIRGLCEFWYPYGSKKRCQTTLDNWLKNDEELVKIHLDYLARKEVEK